MYYFPQTYIPAIQPLRNVPNSPLVVYLLETVSQYYGVVFDITGVVI